MKNIIAVILLLVTSFTYAATRMLNFATDATYPPFESTDNQGHMQGYDVDVIKALCQQMQAQCTFTQQSFDSLIPSLQLGKFDGIFGAMNITPERSQQVDFTNPYYATSASLVAPISSHLTLDTQSLTGKTIGVLSGSTFVPYLQEKYGTAVKVNTYASEQTAFLDLTNGRLDAVMGDTPLIKNWLIQNNHADTYAIVGQPIMNQKYFGGGYGIAVKKGNAPLLQQLNQALTTIKNNGTLEKINHQYFG